MKRNRRLSAVLCLLVVAVWTFLFVHDGIWAHMARFDHPIGGWLALLIVWPVFGHGLLFLLSLMAVLYAGMAWDGDEVPKGRVPAR